MRTNLKWNLVSRLVGSCLALVLTIVLTGCDRATATAPEVSAVPPIENNALTATAGSLAEVNTPIAISKLAPALDKYRPQVQILSPKFDEVLTDDNVTVKIRVDNLPLFKSALGLGNHLHVILDKQTYQGVYDLNQPLVFKNLSPGTHSLRVFASRPWHESFKNEGAYDRVTFHVLTKTTDNNPDPQQPLLTYSRPAGTYGAEPIMLDYYLTNAPSHPANDDNEDRIPDWRIRVTINEQRFILDRWAPVYLQGFKQGKNLIRMELVDDRGNPIPNVYNDNISVFTYDPQQQDTLAKLVTGELDDNLALALVDPNQKVPNQPAPAPTVAAVPSQPTPAPDPISTPQPSIPKSAPTQPPVAIVPQPVAAPAQPPIANNPQPPVPNVSTPNQPPVANGLPSILSRSMPEETSSSRAAATAIAPQPSPIANNPQPPAPSVPTPTQPPVVIATQPVAAPSQQSPIATASAPIATIAPQPGVITNPSPQPAPPQPPIVIAPPNPPVVVTPLPAATPSITPQPATPPSPQPIVTAPVTPQPAPLPERNPIATTPVSPPVAPQPVTSPSPQPSVAPTVKPLAQPPVLTVPQANSPEASDWKTTTIDILNTGKAKIRQFTNTIPAKAQRFARNLKTWTNYAIEKVQELRATLDRQDEG